MTEEASVDEAGDPDTTARARSAGRWQAELRDDMQVIQAYGQDHPEVFAGMWFGGSALHVGLTRLRPYGAELIALLPHPNAVHLHQLPRTSRELARIADELVELMVSGAPIRHMSTGRERVEVAVRAGSSPLAAQLRSRYGDAVEVIDADENPSAPVTARPGPTSTAEHPELELAVLPDSDVLVAGELGRGRLRVTNRSSSRQQLDTDQPLHGYLLGPDGTITGSFLGPGSGTGWGLDLAAGQSQEIAYVVGTETAGYRLTTPGVHQLVVALPLHDTAETPGPGDLVVSPPVSVTVVPPSAAAAPCAGARLREQTP